LVCPSEPAALAETLATALAGASPTLRAAARNLAQQHLAWPAIAAELNSAYAAICRNASLR
jgi:glycosyltransferase involved in cell wall biosynthesis